MALWGVRSVRTLLATIEPKVMPHKQIGSRPQPRPPKRTSRRQQKSADVREPAGHGAKSQAVREQAILALLSEKTIAKAAAKCGVNVRTLARWLENDEDFKIAYSEARRATFEAGMSRVQALAARAIDTLEDLLDQEQYPNVRLGAARTVVELGVHQQDAATIMKKLDELERQQRRGLAER